MLSTLVAEPGLQSSGAQPRPDPTPTKCKCSLYPLRIQEVGDGEMSPGPGQETGERTQRPPQPNTALRAQLLNHFFFFWPHLVACEILVPQPGIEPMPP